MKVPTQTYYVIVSKATPFEYQVDFRIPRLISNDKIQYYRTGDLTTNLIDAYKWEYEEDAEDFLKKNLNGNEDYEVRQLVIDITLI